MIGSLSQVSDLHCVGVAEAVYKSLGETGITGKAVCQALHSALSGLRLEASNSRVENGESSKGKTAKLRDARDSNGDSGDLKGRMKTMDKFFWVPYVNFGV